MTKSDDMAGGFAGIAVSRGKSDIGSPGRRRDPGHRGLEREPDQSMHLSIASRLQVVLEVRRVWDHIHWFRRFSMKRWLVISTAVLCLLFVSGCPYTAQVPLAKPDTRAVDHRLIGNWAGIESDGDSFQIAVFPFGQSEYYAEVNEKTGATTRYRALAFDISDARFLQLNELSVQREAGEYFFARCSFSGESDLVLRFVGDKLVPKALAADSVGLLAFLRDHVSDPALDDEDVILALRRRE